MRRQGFISSVLVCLAFAGSALAADNWIGTWKLNDAKSKLMPNSFRAETLTWAATADGIKLTSTGKDAKGAPATGTFTSKFDGADVAWTGNPLADTAAPKRVDANTYENTWKKSGKVAATAKVVVAADGKSLTITQSGTGADGKPFSSVAVYDKQ